MTLTGACTYNHVEIIAQSDVDGQKVVQRLQESELNNAAHATTRHTVDASEISELHPNKDPGTKCTP